MGRKVIERDELEWGRIMLVVRLIAGKAYGRTLSPNRDQPTTELRWVIMYVLYRKFAISTTDVGIIFNRDHSTVLHGVKRVERFPHLHQRAIAAQALVNAI